MYPTKEELESKWWHRLIKVLVIVSTIIVGVISLLGLGDKCPETYVKNYAYSFEPNYEVMKGEEESCDFFWWEYRNMKDMKIQCGKNFRVDGETYIIDGLKTVSKRDFLERYLIANFGESKAQEMLSEISNKHISYDEMMKELQERGRLNDIRVKIIWHREYQNCILIPAIPVGWFIFSWFILYKLIILYIVYGHKRRS
jgi:hypothetical protein